MGQQQLLLLVLGIVIVGLAVVVGIQAFGENQKKANADAITNDAIRIASDAQAWSLKPQAFGGGDDSLEGVTLAKLGYAVNADGVYVNTNADAARDGANSGFTLEEDAGVVTIVGCNANRGNQVTATVDGPRPEDIETTVENVTSCS